MLGAILGDVIGSRFEFDHGFKSKQFELFTKGNEFTDDTVMTIAIADGILRAGAQADELTLKQSMIKSMLYWGRKYPNAGYGGKFYWWLKKDNPQPYNSFGNGSAMRVSSIGWLYDSLEKTREVARFSAEISHNHPEGIKGAEATASAIFMARKGYSKKEIMGYIIDQFGYDFSRSCDDIRPTYYHVETCQQSVPEALTAFFEGESYEDCIRLVISLGGDCDTTGAICGAVAQAYYGIEDELVQKGLSYLPNEFKQVIQRFDQVKK